MRKTFVGGLAVGVIAGIVAGALLPLNMPGASPLAAGSAAEAPEGPFAVREPVLFEDALGDATDTGTGDAATGLGCFLGDRLSGACWEPLPVPSVGTAGAHYDIVETGFAGETRDEMLFTMTLAELTEGFPGLQTPDALHRMSWFGLCWTTDDDDYCSRNAYLSVMVHDGAAHLESHFDVYVQECNEWWWCSWEVPVELQYGSPGSITFRIPKAYAGIDGLPLAAYSMFAYTGYSEDASAFPMWHPGFTVHTPVRHVHDHTGAPSVYSDTDATGELPLELQFGEPPALPATPLAEPLLLGAPGTHVPGTAYDHPELDILGFDAFEEAGELVFVVAVADWTTQPDFDFDFEAFVGLQGGEVWEIGYRQEGGKAVGYAGECIMAECQDGDIFEVPVEVIPGAPGFLAIRVPLAKLEASGEAPERTTVLGVASMVTDGSQYWGSYESDFFGDVHHAFMVDGVYGGSAYEFGQGHRAPLERFAAALAHH